MTKKQTDIANWALKRMYDFHYPADFQDTEFAYLAGILDGEGTITILRTWKKPRQSDILQPQVSIYNTDTTLIDWLRERVGFKIGGRNRAQADKGNKMVWFMQIWGLKTWGVVEPLLPYLKIKLPHAKVLMAFVEHRATSPYNAPYNQKDIALYEEMQRLNWRGSSPFEPRKLRGRPTI